MPLPGGVFIGGKSDYFGVIVEGIQFLDYSSLIFRSMLPPRRKGKFIQITDGEVEYLVLAPYEIDLPHLIGPPTS